MAKVQELLSKNLARLLKERGLSQVQFAEKMGVTFQTVNGVITGSRSISLGMITRLATTLKIQESDLVADFDEVTGLPDMRELIKQLHFVPPGRRAFLVETWLGEVAELASREQKASPSTKRRA